MTKKQIDVEFERGGKFVADLLEDQAPKTCKAVWDALPLEIQNPTCEIFWGDNFLHVASETFL